MSRFLLLITALCSLCVALAGPAAAQGAPRDSSRVLPRWLELSAEAGVGWMAAPTPVADRYAPGLDVALAAGVRPLPRLRLLVRGEYHDLPGTPSFAGLYAGGSAVPLSEVNSLGDGSVFDALGCASVRLWRDVWCEAGAGYGRFRSGFPDGFSFLDGSTGEVITIEGETGWGAAMTGALTYEFQPNKRDRLYASVRCLVLERDGRRLTLIPLRVGYRFH